MRHFFPLLITSTLAATACLAQTPAAELPAGTYKLDPTHASLIWKVNHMGLSNYTGRFTKFDATLTYDPKDPAKSTLEVTVDPTSVETDYPNPEKEDFNKKLQGAEWFNAGKYSAITFRSTGVTSQDDKHGIVTGDLNFLGQTKPLTLNVTFNGGMAEHPFAKKPAMGFSATGTMKRSNWGFDTYIPTLGDEVQLIIEAEFFHEGNDAKAGESASNTKANQS